MCNDSIIWDCKQRTQKTLKNLILVQFLFSQHISKRNQSKGKKSFLLFIPAEMVQFYFSDLQNSIGFGGLWSRKMLLKLDVYIVKQTTHNNLSTSYYYAVASKRSLEVYFSSFAN